MKRMSWIIIFVFSILALLTLPIKADQWFKVAPHNHTDNSDGLRNFQGLVETTKFFGFDILIVSDHVEKIYQKKGFAAYLKECQADYDDLTVISGTEVTAKTSHTVVFGSLTTKVMSKLNQAQTVSKIIEVAHQNDLLAVAAHPFDLAYLYDRTGADDINGIEFFNGLVVDYAKTFNWYRQMLADNKNVFSWAGIDSHSAADPNDGERWQRQTQVYARSNSAEDICIALRQGHTIASRRGYRLDDLNLIPGFKVQAIQPRFKFKVVSLLPADINDKINLYRDNKVIKSWLIPIGARSKSIDFLDEKCPLGSHTYFIEVASALVTSPIRLEMMKQEIEQATYPPILLGKTRSEIEKMFGKTYLFLNTANLEYVENQVNSENNTYTYGSIPAKYYVTNINFFPYNQKDTVRKPINQVHSVTITFQCFQYDGYQQYYLRPEQMIPPQILDHKPHGVYKGYIDNSIVAVWFIDKKTYLMALCDVPSRPLYTTKIVNEVKKFYPNNNTYDIYHGYVYHFAYVDKIVKITPLSNASDDSDLDYILYIDDSTSMIHCLDLFSKK